MTTTRRRFIHRMLTAGLGFSFVGSPLLAAQDQLYRVKRGDTLSGIAADYGVTVRQLKAANGLTGDLIRVGQMLKIPRAVRGDALAPVAAANRSLRVDRSHWRFIVAHHSAVERGNAAIYDSNHRRRGMQDGLAYHFVIGNGLDSGDGEIEVGNRWKRQLRGGHVRSSEVNDRGIGICIVGNLENHPPSAKQYASFFSLVDYLRSGYVSPACKLTVHKWVDLRHTLCPGRHFPYGDYDKRYRS